jgi:hypothetical protein
MKTELENSNYRDATNLKFKQDKIDRKLNEMLETGLVEGNYNINPNKFRGYHQNISGKLNTINYSMIGSSKKTNDVDLPNESLRNSIQFVDKDSQKLDSIL